MTKITEQLSQRKTLFSNNFQKTNLIIGGCVRTTHPDIFFTGERRNYYNALIEIPLLVTTIVAGEFCYQQLPYVLLQSSICYSHKFTVSKTSAFFHVKENFNTMVILYTLPLECTRYWLLRPKGRTIPFFIEVHL